jgi:hypothetical protein
MSIDYSEKIPNNVDLASNRMLQRALEHWQPEFQHWWADMGPEGTSAADVYLRTAISVEPKGWAHFDYVKMPDYRWGIFLAPAEAGRKVNFGAHKGEAAWQEVPGEYRSNLRRHHRCAHAFRAEAGKRLCVTTLDKCGDRQHFGAGNDALATAAVNANLEHAPPPDFRRHA